DSCTLFCGLARGFRPATSARAKCYSQWKKGKTSNEEKSEKKKELYRHVEVEQEAEEPMYTSEDNETKEKDDDDKCEENIRENQDDENIQGIEEYRTKSGRQNPSTNEEVFIVCHGCGKHGHVIKNCDKKRGSYTHRYANRGRSSSRSSRGYQGPSRFRSFSSQRGMRQHESYSSNSAQTDDEHQDVISFTAEEKSEKKKELYRHVEVEQEAEEPMYTSEDNETKEKDDDDKCEENIRENQDDENIQGIEEYRTKSGRQVWVHILPKQDKLEKRARTMIFTGYAPNGYRVWNPETNQITISRDIRFDESQYTYSEEKSEKKKELYRHVEVEQEAEEPMYTSEDNETKEKDDDDKCEENIRENQDDENIQGIEEYRTKSGRQGNDTLLKTENISVMWH
ncbi:hypothetical protein ACJJTC_000550, partial [Scirpophaga incertulas]